MQFSMKKILLLLLLAITYCGFSQNPSDRDPTYNSNFNLPPNYFFIKAGITNFKSQSDNKTIFFVDKKKLVRLEDNLQDTSFNVTFSGGDIYDFCVLPNDQIMVVGTFTHCNDQYNKSIVRLNADGSIDHSFSSGTDNTDKILGVESTFDGQLIVKSDNNYYYDGIALDRRIFRLQHDGSLDDTFVCTIPFPKVFKVQDDGKVIAYSNSTFARYLINGELDPNFAPMTVSSPNTINSILIEDDGKIVIAGVFNSGTTLNNTMIIRLTENGSIDTTFGIVATSLTEPFVYRTVRDVVKQSDGKYVISGLFEDINGVENYKIARLNADGTHDTSAFHGFNDSFNGDSPYLYQQPNGKIIISGFTEFNRLYYNDHFTTHVV